MPQGPLSPLGFPGFCSPVCSQLSPLLSLGPHGPSPQDNGHRELQPAWSVALRSPAPGGQGTSSHHLENRRRMATWATQGILPGGGG